MIEWELNRREGPARIPTGKFSLARATTLAILALSFAVRLFHLGAMGFEFDEAFSVQAGRQSVPGIIQMLATGEPHPPLYYTLLHFWYPVVGATEFALRYPTVFANVLTIVFLIRIADWFDWTLAGRLAALFVALNPWQIWYAQEARMYAPVALFGAAAVYFALRAIRSGGRRDLAWYAGFLLLALFTHYYAIFLAVSINLVVLSLLRFGPPGPLHWRSWLLTQAGICAIYLPWLGYAYRIAMYYVRAAPSTVNLPGVVRDALTYYSLGRSMPKPQEAQLSLAFLAVLVVGVLATTRGNGKLPRWFSTAFLLIYLLGPLCMGFVVSLVRSMYIPQYFFVSSPAFFLALGLGAAWLIKRVWPAGVVVAGVLVGLQLLSVQNYFFNPNYNKAEVVDAINYVESHLRPGDGIILDGPEQVTQFDWYHDVRWKDPSPSIVFPLSGPDNWQRTPEAIDSFMKGRKGAWFLDYGVESSDSQHVVQAYLSENYFPTLYQPINHNRVLYFTTAPDSPPKVIPLNLTCGDRVSLVSLSVYSTSTTAGGVIPLSLRWQALKSAPGDYALSWRLMDPAGHLVVQQDSRPAGGFSPSNNWQDGQFVDDHYGLAIPSFAIPGDYQLVAQVYEPKTGQICLPTRDGKSLPGIQIPLTTIRVTNGTPLPSLSAPRPRYPVNQTFGPLRLLGYDLRPGPYHPGDVVTIRLYWTVQSKVSEMFAIKGALLGGTDEPLAQVRVPVGLQGTTGSGLAPGQLLVSYVDLTVPPTASSTAASVSLSLMEGRITRPLLASPPSLNVVSRPQNFARPTISHATSVDLGGKAFLVGYDLAPSTDNLAPGKTLAFTLYWHAVNKFGVSYKVFTHLVGPDGQIHGQRDSLPLGGAAPTTSWAPGEYLADRYEIPISPDAPAGTYQLVVGMYDANTGARLPVNGGKADQIVVTTVKIGKGN